LAKIKNYPATVIFIHNKQLEQYKNCFTLLHFCTGICIDILDHSSLQDTPDHTWKKIIQKVWTLLCILREQKPATGEESKKKPLKLELDGALDTLYLD